MSNEKTLQGRWALVTGASSGLGVDFAHDLAGRGANLVLVARREDRLLAVRETVEARHGVQVIVIATDLADRSAPDMLYATLDERGIAIDILINNAGLGLYGAFLDIPWEREHMMLELDIVTLTHLTKLFLPGMVARNYGYVLQVASIGAYQPSPLYASYSAAKAYVLSFGEAINYELRQSPVRVTVVSPGVTRTEFLDVSGQKPTFYQRMMMMDSPTVVRIGVDAMLRGRPSVVPGWLNAVTVWSNRIMPRRMATAIGYRLMKSN